MMRLFIAILFALAPTVLFTSTDLSAEETSIDVEENEAAPSLGVDYDVTVVVSHDAEKSVAIEEPVSDETTAFFFKHVTETREKGLEGVSKTTFVLRFVPLSIGEFRLPILKFKEKGAGAESSNTLELPLLKIGGPNWTSETLPEPKGFSNAVISTTRSVWPYYALVGCVFALLVAAFMTFKKRAIDKESLRSEKNNEAEIGPWESALRELELAEHRFLQDSTLKKFYMSVSESLRRFLGLKHQYSTLDLTTAELCSSLRSRISDESTFNVIRRWLETCDLVKYAKKESDLEDARNLVVEIKRWIEVTRPQATENS